MENELDEVWLRKRKHTTAAFAIQNLVLGIEYSLTLLTLWLYIKEMIHTSSPKLLYTSVSVCYLISTAIFTPIVGLMVDRNRNIRCAFASCNCFLIIGNLLYSMYFSQWFLLAGSFINGFGGALRAIIGSEIVRSYPADESVRVLSLMSLLYNCGFLVAPGILFIFADVDVYIGAFHLKTVNSLGIIMASLEYLMVIVTFFIISDLSKQFDFKAHFEENAFKNQVNENNSQSSGDNISDLIISESTPLLNNDPKSSRHINDISISIVESVSGFLSSTHSTLKLTKTLYSNRDTALVLFSTMFVMFSIVTFDMWLPLLVVDKMCLKLTDLNIIVFGAGAFCDLMLALSIWKPIRGRSMLVILSLGIFGLALINGTYFVGKLIPHPGIYLKIVLAIIYAVGFGGGGIIPDVLLLTALASMVHSNVQTYCESIRYSMYSLGSLIALLSAVYVFDYITEFALIYICILMFICFSFFIRRNSFIHPSIKFT